MHANRQCYCYITGQILQKEASVLPSPALASLPWEQDPSYIVHAAVAQAGQLELFKLALRLRHWAGELRHMPGIVLDFSRDPPGVIVRLGLGISQV